MGGAKKLNPVFTDMKPRPEKKHSDKGQSTTNTFEDDLKGKGTFVQHNRKTVEEYKLESKMQAKQRTGTLYDQRNGLPMCSLGDKVYKAVEYQTGFFKEGGLIVGST